MKTVLQVELVSGSAHRVCWVDMQVRVGDVVTLKGDERKWTVTEMYNVMPLHEINRGWHNNI